MYPGKNQPYYPNKPLTYGSIFFFIRSKTHSLNAFDKESIEEAKQLILKEARDASPSYKTFIQAATKATGLSERSLKKILYKKENK